MEPVDYSVGLPVVDTLNTKIAVVSLERKTGDDLRPALGKQKAFEHMGRKQEMLYTDAEARLAKTKTQDWFAHEKHVAYNITLKHAPVAARMIG